MCLKSSHIMSKSRQKLLFCELPFRQVCNLRNYKSKFGGAPAGAKGAAARRGRFFKEKAPQKPFLGKVFLWPNGGSANMVRPCRRGRAQYLPRAKTVSGGRFFFGPIFLWAERKQSQ